MQALNDALDELGLTDTYRTFHLKATNPSNSLGLATCWAQVRLGKFQKIKIIPSIFSDHTTRLEINYKNKTLRNTNIWQLNNMLLNNCWITDEMKEEIKKYLETNENESTIVQNLWHTAKAFLKGKFIAIQSYLKKQEKSQINNLTLHLKQLEKEEQTKPKVSRRKQIIKIRAKISEIETKKTIANINETNS